MLDSPLVGAQMVNQVILIATGALLLLYLVPLQVLGERRRVGRKFMEITLHPTRWNLRPNHTFFKRILYTKCKIKKHKVCVRN